MIRSALLVGAAFLTFTLCLSYPALAGPIDLVQLADQIATEEGADPAIVKALADHESRWNPQAVGDQGRSVGLLQLHQNGLGRGMTVEERMDPAINLRVGSRALVTLWNRYNAIEPVLASYNAGSSAMASVNHDWRRLYGGSVARQFVYPVLAKAEEYRAGVGE